MGVLFGLVTFVALLCALFSRGPTDISAADLLAEMREQDADPSRPTPCHTSSRQQEE